MCSEIQYIAKKSFCLFLFSYSFNKIKYLNIWLMLLEEIRSDKWFYKCSTNYTGFLQKLQSLEIDKYTPSRCCDTYAESISVGKNADPSLKGTHSQFSLRKVNGVLNVYLTPKIKVANVGTLQLNLILFI